jgi:hypothetical protein
LFTVLFTFPSRYLFTIGLPGVFSLTGWCRRIQPGFLLSRPTQDTRLPIHASPTGLSPSAVCLPRQFGSHSSESYRSYYPVHAVTCTVWAVPLSLATTYGITLVFSSSAYLDVSVRRVCLPLREYRNKSRWVAPFGHPRISPACGSPRLFAAYHVLLRLWEPRHPPCALVHLLFTHIRLLLRIYALFISAPIAWNFYSVAFSAQHVNELFPGSRPENGNVKTETKGKTGFQKGGVPAAPSGTATLLRLSPSYRFYP